MSHLKLKYSLDADALIFLTQAYSTQSISKIDAIIIAGAS